MRMFAIAAMIGVALTPVHSALAAGSFDGTWNVEIICPEVGDVEGYDWRFQARVASGGLIGEYHSSMNEAAGRLSGRIRPDGQALLTLIGRTGPAQVAIGDRRPGTPFRYTANVHFDERSGSGMRNERRACSLTFSKA
jgi:hypothetical protein